MKATIRKLFADFSNYGFAPAGRFCIKRNMPHLEQFLEVQPGRGWLKGKHAINLCWKFTTDGAAETAVYDFRVNAGWLGGGAELWLGGGDATEAGPSYEVLQVILLGKGVDFLQEVGDLERMTALYEKAERTAGEIIAPLDARLFFGVDEGWRHYNLAFAYQALGHPEKASVHFHAVIERCSEQPHEWVMLRRDRCTDALKELS